MRLLKDLVEYYENVKAGADPIEALHGHLCGPKCLHWSSMTRERRATLLKAPWNRDEDPSTIDDETLEEMFRRMDRRDGGER